MSDDMFFTFCVCLAGMLLLAAALYSNELAGKRLDARLRELREVRGGATARRISQRARRLLGALLAYVLIISAKLARLEREVGELVELARGVADFLVWPALLAYSEAAVAYVGVLRRPTPAARLAIWGVRVGWVAHTALLVAQAVRADGFAWSSLAGLLNLFVWVSVGVYLIWGCSPRFRLLGLAVMPSVAALFAIAAVAGGSAADASDAFVAAHVVLLVGGFARSAWPPRSPCSTSGRSDAAIARGGCAACCAAAVAHAGRARRPTAAVGLALFSAGLALGLARGARRRCRRRRRTRRVDGVRGGAYGTPGARLAWSSLCVRVAHWFRARCASRSASGASRMRITLVGVSHHRAPVALRERVALDLGEAAGVASTLAAACGESVCLSTCNRTELYIAHDSEQDAGDAARALLLEREPALADALYQLQDEAAALHLFRVAAGLDSLVPGEGEILGQVRLAFEAGAAGPMLGRLFRQALYAGRRARVQTAIGEAPASISSAAAALAHQVFGDLRGRRILLVGAGKVSEQARNLLSRGAEIAIVANRSSARAEELAGTFGASAIGLDRIDDELASADIVVASTSAPSSSSRAIRSNVHARGAEAAAARRPGSATRPRSGDPDAERLLPVRPRRPRSGRHADAHRSSPRGRSGRVARCGGGGALPCVAGVARRGAWRSRRFVRGRRRSGDASSKRRRRGSVG